jgi:PAS domain S-box-containing protein
MVFVRRKQGGQPACRRRVGISFHPLSIKSKAALFAAAGVLFVLTVFAGIEVHRVRAEMQEVLGSQQLTLISRIADALDDRISSTHRALIVTAEAVPPAALADVAAMERSLSGQPGFRSLFDDVYLIGRDGKVLIDMPPLNRRGIDVTDRDYFRRSLESRKPVISDPYVGRGRKEPTVMMAAPIVGRDGEVAGVLAGAIHLFEPNFLGKLRQARVGSSGRFILISRDRTIIASQDADRIMTKGPEPGLSPAFDHAIAGNEGWEEAANRSGARALYSYKPLASVPWILMAALPVEEAYAPIEAAQREAIAIAAVLAALLAPVIWLGMYFLLVPLGALRDTIRQIRGDPDSDAQVRTPRNDELGDIAGEFNAMVRERRLAGEALRTSQERYRGLTELSSDWYWEQDENFRFISLRGRQPGIEGATRAEALGKTPWELPMLRVTKAEWAVHQAQLEAHQAFRDFEVCRPDADGNPAYALISGQPVFDEDDRFRGYRGVGRDITKVRAAERESQFRQKLESILLVMSTRFLNAAEGEVDAIIQDTLREIGKFAEADRCFINLLDVQAHIYSVSHEWSAPGVEPKLAARQNVPIGQADSLWESLERDKVAYVNSAELPPGSPLLPILQSAGIKSTVGVPMVSGGELIGCLGFDAVVEQRRWSDDLVVLMRIAADVLGGIIAQRRAAAALRASEEKFAKAFRSGPMFVSISTVDGARYIEVNEAFLRGTGRRREDIIGRTAYDIGLWKFPQARKRATEVLGRDGRLRSYEAELCKKSGESMTCEIWAELIEIEGRQCVIWLTVDITERKQAEAQILKLNETLEQRVHSRTVELEAAVRDLAAFSYSISHDLRAPLRSIVAFSKMLAEDLKGKLEGENQRFLERVIDNAARMSRLIDEVLQYSRLARIEVARRQVDLDRLVRDVVDELRDQYPGAEVVLNPLGSADADPTMMRQIFHNLIGNALKYSSKRSNAQVEIGAGSASGSVEYFVRDNGVGFDMSHADRLFELFSRLHSDPAFEGTGAGLAIVKRLVERHGGSVRANAEPGNGATFRFSV